MNTSLLRRAALTGSILAAVLVFTAPVSATTASVSRSYAAATKITPGSIVSLTNLESKTVTLSNSSNSDKIIGVAVAEDGSLLVVNPDSSRVQVTTSGIVQVLVSDVNGAIKSGDKVAVSPFDGLGMKSGSGERIIGLAQSSFTASSEATETKEVTDKQGDKKTLRIGSVQINVVIGNDDSGIDQRLNGSQRLVRSLTGKVVSPTRIIASFVIGIFALIALVTLLYTAVYASIIAIGRNPLAKGAIIQALRRAFAIAALILILALGFISLLLR